nr:ABC transporter ATP-binding protein [Pseudomonas sp. BIGb0427]
MPLIALAHLADSLQQAPPLAPGVMNWVLLAVLGSALWLCGQTLALHLTHGVDADLCERLRVRLAEHLQRLPLGWFARLGPEGVTRYAEQDVRALHQLVGHAPTDLVNLLLIPWPPSATCCGATAPWRCGACCHWHWGCWGTGGWARRTTVKMSSSAMRRCSSCSATTASSPPTCAWCASSRGRRAARPAAGGTAF